MIVELYHTECVFSNSKRIRSASGTHLPDSLSTGNSGRFLVRKSLPVIRPSAETKKMQKTIHYVSLLLETAEDTPDPVIEK
jgi:hypothetical protein